MKSRSSHPLGDTFGAWTALGLCTAVLAARALEPLVSDRPAYAFAFGPYWLPLAATVLAAAGIMLSYGRSEPLRLPRALLWGALLLMVWAANGLPFDLLRLTPLIPMAVDWPGLARRTLAFAAAVALARMVLAHPSAPPSARAARWFGYAGFVLALPYPVLRTIWALGGTLGLDRPGAGGHGWAPWLLGIPWLLAAALSLLLVSTRPLVPRRLLLAAGSFATGIVALIGPAAFWAFLTRPAVSAGPAITGIAAWVFGLFYGSWLLWAVAAGVATRAYQLRTAGQRLSSAAA
jgi:hypothetical protein